MDIITPVNPMLTDEHVLAVDPKPLPDGVETDRKRLNAFQGRALSAQALTDRQISRMASQAMLHRSVSAGIVSGLELFWLEPDKFVVRPGIGLTASGEDIFLGNTQQFVLDDLAVLLPQTDGSPPALKNLAALKADPVALQSHAAILLAVPVSFASNDVVAPPQGKFVPRDPVDDPFAGLTETDGCLFALYPYPAYRPVDAARPFDPARQSFRNDLTQAIFAVEQGFGPGDCHPWEEAGLPLALLGFKADWSLQFVDHASVVRVGGRKNESAKIIGAGNPSLWQARIEQFGEQLGGMKELPEKMASLQDMFPKLPPVGFMPRRLAGFASPDSIFPATFNLRALPVPDDQLATIIRECSAMDEIDLGKGEDVELAFPVPAADYDPMLMWTANIAPDFDEAIHSFVDQRNEWLGRREMVHAAHQELAYARRGDFDVRASSEVLDKDERAAAFAARRLLKLVDGRTLPFNAPRNHAWLGAGESLYAWIWLDAGAKRFTVFFSGKPSASRKADAKSSFHRFSAIWGKPAEGEGGSSTIKELPSEGAWVRVDVSYLDFLTGKTIPENEKMSDAMGLDVIAFAMQVDGGSALVAELGTMDASGNETPILTDSLPDGEPQEFLASDFASVPWVSLANKLTEDNYGTSLKGDVRVIPQFDSFTDKVAHLKFLGTEAARLAALPLAQLIDELSAQINATNDAVDLGFLMARANTFRVREFMLGSDAASRLLTSPSLADVVKQDSSARVTGEQLQNFLEKSKFNFTPGG